jgi:hypothetical protein
MCYLGTNCGVVYLLHLLRKTHLKQFNINQLFIKYVNSKLVNLKYVNSKQGKFTQRP